ncbi:MAG TPA: heavy metal-binding domain-containing protein, partial [Lutibacter sp.]|nr:heavy metal-binding domain-containing protein [Lutibacter sp.]
MKHTYKISGMTCNGCRTNAEKTLNNIKGVLKATVNLEEGKVEVEMENHISTETFQQEFLKAGLHYSIADFDPNSTDEIQEKPINIKPIKDGNGIFYCPMHCEGEKTYEKAGDCPVCGMDLIEQPKAIQASQYTCPMHPEIISEEPGSCPICGMDLVLKEPSESEEYKTYLKLLKKMKISLIFAIPVFIISMTMHLPS